MSTPKSAGRSGGDVDLDGASASTPGLDAPYNAPPTYATFSSTSLSTVPTAAQRRSTILVHQKSPLLMATPPQITRALAYSHPFLLPLNKLAGLLSWTTGDPWESFLLLVVFWATVLYGDVAVRWAGPIVVVLGIIAGMYGRRYSPLSSSGWADHPSWTTDKKKARSSGSDAEGDGRGHQRNSSEVTNTRHQKTLDEIVETLKVFTTRCNILLEPLLKLTEFLSTQRTATSATTRPALTALFLRILAVTPLWIALTLPPLRIITTRRVVMLFGTLVLSWHSRVLRVSRTLLWRSSTVRRMARWITGLEFQGPRKPTPAGTMSEEDTKKNETIKVSQSTSALTAALKRSRGGKDAGVRFTFIIYENQRRWVGLGWTSTLFAYERTAWTDEHNNAVPPREKFELPEVEDGPAKWRWVKGSKWKVDGAAEVGDEADYDGDAGKNGWIYYDNKWQGGRRGQDGWGRWTRRRKWYRDAELVEVDDIEETNGAPTMTRPRAASSRSPEPPELPARPKPHSRSQSHTHTPQDMRSNSDMDADADTDSVSMLSSSSKSTGRFLFTPSLRRRATNDGTAPKKVASRRSTSGSANGETVTTPVGSLERERGELGNKNEGDLTPALELAIQGSRKAQDSWGIGDEIAMSLD